MEKSDPPRTWRQWQQQALQRGDAVVFVAAPDSNRYALFSGTFLKEVKDGPLEFFVIRAGRTTWWVHPSRVFVEAAASDAEQEQCALNAWLQTIAPL